MDYSDYENLEFFELPDDFQFGIELPPDFELYDLPKFGIEMPDLFEPMPRPQEPSQEGQSWPGQEKPFVNGVNNP